MKAPLDVWERTREDIRKALLDKGFDSEIEAFTQAFGSTALDASALLIPRAGFLPATDPRVQSTVESIQKNLGNEGLIYRYHSNDGISGHEGVFITCTFWLIDALALGGRLEEAHLLFEKTTSYANDLGLLSEELDWRNKLLLGNFPQGFTHMALINAAINLATTTKHGAEEQAQTETERAKKAGKAVSEGYNRPA